MRASDREHELFRLLLRLDRIHASIGDAHRTGERRHLAPHWSRFSGPEIGAPPVEIPVVRHELGPVLGEAQFWARMTELYGPNAAHWSTVTRETTGRDIAPLLPCDAQA